MSYYKIETRFHGKRTWVFRGMADTLEKACLLLAPMLPGMWGSFRIVYYSSERAISQVVLEGKRTNTVRVK